MSLHARLSLEAARAVRRQGTAGLLADVPRSRLDDPNSSHEAAEAIRRTGILHAHQQIVLETVRNHPGATYVEIAGYSGLERHAVARRLKELEPMHIRRGGEVKRPGPRPLLTWWPVER